MIDFKRIWHASGFQYMVAFLLRIPMGREMSIKLLEIGRAISPNRPGSHELWADAYTQV